MPTPEQLDIAQIGFAAKLFKAEATGARNIYMSANKESGFTRANNLAFQACEPSAPLHSPFKLSEPQQGTKTRWSLDVEVPIDCALYSFLNSLNELTREEVRVRAAECFPRMKTERMSDDQLNMAYLPCFKTQEDGPGKLKLKVIMPPPSEEAFKMAPTELERRMKDITQIFEVTSYQPKSADCPEGVFEVVPSTHDILKPNCKIMPLVTTSGIWLNDSQCGISFVCTKICVWPVASPDGVDEFELGGIKPIVGTKRVREDVSVDDEPDGASYEPMVEPMAEPMAEPM